MNEDIQKEDHREDSSPTKQLEHEKDKDQATVSTELEEVRVVETEQTLILGKGSEEDKNYEGNKVALKETEWSDVTPGKACRSPKKKKLRGRTELDHIKLKVFGACSH
ncbi:hypothetical protein DY000_02028940 [Brassica cretica]|uniref:Uncharacterized protein n=1 Tax=Brassica cretica TaxID=69181 RepID=A0ABQ7DHG5_BRACR|nr:hypothetical protein DY000_02028940 [Brassica cretica]